MMHRTGPLLSALLTLYAAVLGAQTYAAYGTTTALGIALGAASIAAMSLALVLSTRPRWLEPLFGGLDHMYGAHKWLGIAALALMLGHNTLEPDLEDFVRETRWGDFAADSGEWALNGFIGLIMISWIKRIPFTRLELPWSLWRFSHRFTGPLFAIAAFHQLAIDKPAEIDPRLDHFLNALSLIGIAAWIFTQAIAPLLRRRAFVIDRMDRQGAVTTLQLRPLGRSMRWRPGQFAFIKTSPGWTAQAHPLTLASAPKTDGSVRLHVKALGDWTRRLPERLAPGQHLWIDGPYGRFLLRRKVQHQVWLAGGIGITPFLAWAESLTEADQQNITLVWAVTRREEAFAADQLADIALRHPPLQFQVVASQEEGRLTAQRLLALVPFSMRDAHLFYCGPTGLYDAIVRDLQSEGQSPRRTHHEAFALR